VPLIDTRMKNQLLRRLGVLLALMATTGVNAQTENSAFSITGKGVGVPFATDYHALGINPSNLDWPSDFEGRVATFGVFEMGSSIYSEALGKEDLRNNLIPTTFDKLTDEEKLDVVKNFTESSIAIDVDIMPVGFHMNTQNAGGFAFMIRDRVDYFSNFGPLVAEIGVLGYQADYWQEWILTSGDTIPAGTEIPDGEAIEQGYTPQDNALLVSEILDGSTLSMQWTREYQIGYGKKVYSTDDYAIYGGVGLKYISGTAFLQIDGRDGKATAFSAMSPFFEIDYGPETAANPTALPLDSTSLIPKPVGQGFGVDLGMSILLKDKFRFGISLTDLGSITWDGNVHAFNDLQFTEIGNGGIETLSIIESVSNLTGSEGILEWQGSQSIKSKLPTTVRVGAGLLLNKKLRVGGEAIIPVNNDLVNYDKAILGVGGDFAPVPWIQLSAGFLTGGNYDFKVPAGITFQVANGAWEAGVASRDIITFFSENQPTISASFGFLRFRV